MSSAVTFRRPVTVAATALIATALVLATASPASAAGRNLASGDAMFVVDCEELSDVMVWSIDASTAASTELPSPTAHDDEACTYQGAYDAATGTSYAAAEFIPSGNGAGLYTALMTVNTTTGETTVIGEFVDNTDAKVAVTSIAIGAGSTAHAIDEAGALYWLDLATGKLLEIGTIDYSGGTLWGFAYNPVDGQFYVSSAGEILRLYPSTLAVTPVYVPTLAPSTDLYAIQFDSAGLLWALNVTTGPTQLWSFDLTAAQDESQTSGDLLVFNGNEFFGTQSLLVTRAAASLDPAAATTLPATGLPAPSSPLMTGAALGLLLGVVLLARRRRIS